MSTQGNQQKMDGYLQIVRRSSEGSVILEALQGFRQSLSPDQLTEDMVFALLDTANHSPYPKDDGAQINYALQIKGFVCASLALIAKENPSLGRYALTTAVRFISGLERHLETWALEKLENYARVIGTIVKFAPDPDLSPFAADELVKYMRTNPISGALVASTIDAQCRREDGMTTPWQLSHIDFMGDLAKNFAARCETLREQPLDALKSLGSTTDGAGLIQAIGVLSCNDEALISADLAHELLGIVEKIRDRKNTICLHASSALGHAPQAVKKQFETGRFNAAIAYSFSAADLPAAAAETEVVTRESEPSLQEPRRDIGSIIAGALSYGTTPSGNN